MIPEDLTFDHDFQIDYTKAPSRSVETEIVGSLQEAHEWLMTEGLEDGVMVHGLYELRHYPLKQFGYPDRRLATYHKSPG